MLLTKTVIIKLTSQNIEYYKQKGYDTSQKEIEVDVFDLKENCVSLVDIRCDYCGEYFKRRWSNYIKSLHDDFKKDACAKCSGKRVAEYKKIKYKTFKPTFLPNESLFKRKSYSEIKQIYDYYGCKLLLTEEEYNNSNASLKKIIAPYVCSCGRRQDGRSISYFINEHQFCEVCAKEKRRRDDAFKLHNDYESVKAKMLSEHKELLTYKEYFIKQDDIEYRCLLCGSINKIKYYTYKDSKNIHVCKGCREKQKRIEQWNRICNIAKESNLVVLTSFDDFLTSYANSLNETRICFKCSCGNDFVTRIGEFLNSNKRQCNECGLKARSGEFSPMWKGGITSEHNKIRNSKEYADWRNAVFERDNYTCVCCGDNSGGNLSAHHINNFSDHEDLRFVLSNGITLCDSCHNPNKIGSFHNIYGTHNNNLSQIIEYIADKRKQLNLLPIDMCQILDN